MLKFIIGLLLASLVQSVAGSTQTPINIKGEIDAEYNHLLFQITNKEKDPSVISKLKKESFLEQSLI